MKNLTPLQFALLTSLADAPSHGYALIAAVEPLLGRRPGVATVYTALDYLAGAGCIVQAQDEVVDGRLRRHFAITAPGKAVLAAEAQVLARRVERAQRALRHPSPVAVGA